MNVVLNGRVSRPESCVLLEDLRQFAKVCGKVSVTYKEYRLAGRFYPTIFVRRFGSWNSALLAAGLEPCKLFNVSAEVLLANLEGLWVALGRQPVMADLVPPLSKFGRRPYVRVFGSWGNAVKAAFESGERSAMSGADDTFRESAFSLTPALSKGEGGVTYSYSNSSSNKLKIVSKRATPREPGWRLRYLVMKRDCYRCVLCGASPAVVVGTVLHVDHIVAYSNGGESVMENLQTLCEVCNGGKSNL